MTQLFSYISAHPTMFSLIAYYVMCAAVGSLDMPDATSGKFYRWFFKFSNAFAANINRLAASKLPKDDAPKQP